MKRKVSNKPFLVVAIVFGLLIFYANSGAAPEGDDPIINLKINRDSGSPLFNFPILPLFNTGGGGVVVVPPPVVYPEGAIFVSNTGSDVNNGLSVDTPIKTISKLNSIISGSTSVKVFFERGSFFRLTTDNYIKVVSGSSGDWSVYTNYGDNDKPLPLFYGSIEASDAWTSLGNNVWEYPSTGTITKDVGNIIFNNGDSIGVKKWDDASLTSQGDFYMVDPAKTRSYTKVRLYSTRDPLLVYDDIELAITNDLLSVGPSDYVVVDGLDLRYGALHGINGGNSDNVILVNNNIYMIGGGLQRYNAGVPLRYGNCVQFGCAHKNVLVVNNTIDQCYDAGLTSQSWDGCGVVRIVNVTYTGNVVKNSHYGYEYFVSNTGSIVDSISVDHNTFIGQGYEAWYYQRPDGGYGQMRLSRTPATTTDYFVVNNIIVGGRDYGVVIGSGSDYNWKGELVLDNNLYYDNKYLVRWGTTTYTTIDSLRTAKNQELNGVVANPSLNNYYKPSGTACSMSSTGGYVGAVKC